MSTETVKCPQCKRDCGFDPSTGEVWCPECLYFYSPTMTAEEMADARADFAESIYQQQVSDRERDAAAAWEEAREASYGAAW